MISCINLVLDGTDRRSIRKQLVESFLEEEAGSGTGENCSVYRYGGGLLKSEVVIIDYNFNSGRVHT